MNLAAVEPDRSILRWLPGAQFADAFAITVDRPIDARLAAERMLGRSPRWVSLLMRLRNRLVSPFGLKTPHPDDAAVARATIGIFPVISESAERMVAGFDDHHLDFRVVVDVVPEPRGQRVTATTLVLTHNLLGRTYLAVILPFHRVIVRSMLQQI
jgi:Protein of unknown function (DUF2867)